MIMKRRVPVLDRDALTAEIAGLSKANIKDLRERWQTLYGKEPSGHIGRSFLIRAIAYRLQEKAFGGLKPSTRRLLARVAEETAARSSPKSPPVRKAETGTILVREWQGAAHRVTALRDLHPQILRRRTGAGLQLAARAARGVRSVHQEPGRRRLASVQGSL